MWWLIDTQPIIKLWKNNHISNNDNNNDINSNSDDNLEGLDKEPRCFSISLSSRLQQQLNYASFSSPC